MDSHIIRHYRWILTDRVTDRQFFHGLHELLRQKLSKVDTATEAPGNIR